MAGLVHGGAERVRERQFEKSVSRLVEEYIQQAYSVRCEVADMNYQHYNYGITGGLYMYEFACKGPEGLEFTASYRSYSDLTESTVKDLSVSGIS